jgi:hypothetical protein
LVEADQLRRASMNVDLQEMEAAAFIRRRLNQAAPNRGGWNVFFGLQDRSVPNTNPCGNPMIRADGLAAFDGWPTSPRIEALRVAWLDAGGLDEQRRICAELQMQLWQDVPFIPMGEYWQSTAIGRICSTCCPAASPSLYGSVELSDQPRDSYREEIGMRRRDLFKAAGASVAAPRIGRGAKPNKLVFVPGVDLAGLPSATPRDRRRRLRPHVDRDDVLDGPPRLRSR